MVLINLFILLIYIHTVSIRHIRTQRTRTRKKRKEDKDKNKNKEKKIRKKRTKPRTKRKRTRKKRTRTRTKRTKTGMISSSWFEFSMTGIGLTVPPVLVAVVVSAILYNMTNIIIYLISIHFTNQQKSVCSM